MAKSISEVTEMDMGLWPASPLASRFSHPNVSMTVYNKIRGILALTGIVLSTTVIIGPFYVLTLIKLILPWHAARVRLSQALVVVAETWMSINNVIIGISSGLRWEVEGLEGLRRDDWLQPLRPQQALPPESASAAGHQGEADHPKGTTRPSLLPSYSQ